MVYGLTLVLVMLVTLALSGISGLLSYRDTVRDLEHKKPGSWHWHMVAERNG